MMLSRFARKLDGTNASAAVCLLLRPRVTQMPLPIQRFDDPFLPFGKALIDATRDLVSAYMFDLAAYLALGGAGAVALERTIAYATDRAVILHGPFASVDYVNAAGDAAFNVDAVTVTDRRLVEPYAPLLAFVVQAECGSFPVYSPETTRLMWGEASRLHVAADDVVYAGRGDDFADAARAALKEAVIDQDA